jgi:hypothetical protein
MHRWACIPREIAIRAEKGVKNGKCDACTFSFLSKLLILYPTPSRPLSYCWRGTSSVVGVISI